MSTPLGFVFAALLSALLSWVTLRLGRRAGWVDRPGGLKLHAVPVPTLGGLAIIASFLSGLWLVEGFSEAFSHDLHYLLGITLAGLLITGLGIWDDLVGCSAWQKFSVQVMAALTLYGLGYGIPEVTNPFGTAISLDFLGFPVTILWVVGITNAINLIDGVDGLAAGVTLTSCVALAVIAFHHEERLVMTASLLLAGSLAGFLGFNLPPAKIFLGDTGSLFLGLAMSAISLLENFRKGTVAVTLLLPIVLMAIPIVDTLLAISRRVLSGRHPFQGDTGHLHHRLLNLGLSPKGVLAVFYGFSVTLGAAAFVLSVLPKQHVMVLIVILAVSLYLCLRALHLVETKRRASVGEAVPGASGD